MPTLNKIYFTIKMTKKKNIGQHLREDTLKLKTVNVYFLSIMNVHVL